MPRIRQSAIHKRGCSVIANAPAIPSSNFAAASATEVVIASQFAQTITFAQPPDPSLSAGTYTLTAMANTCPPLYLHRSAPRLGTPDRDLVFVRTASWALLRSQPS